MDVNKIKKGDKFNEFSVYIVEDVVGNKVKFKHLKSNSSVTIDKSYIEKCMHSGDQFSKVVKVGLRDKYHTSKTIQEAIKNGKFKNEKELPTENTVRLEGIQTIFHKIPVDQVFTVTFRKKGEEISDSEVLKKKETLVAEAIKRIESVQKAKKGVKDQAEKELKELLNTNISNYIPGDVRTLVGVKTKEYSNTGYYNVIDLNYPDGDKGTNERLVNINSIESVIVNDILFVVE